MKRVIVALSTLTLMAAFALVLAHGGYPPGPLVVGGYPPGPL